MRYSLEEEVPSLVFEGAVDGDPSILQLSIMLYSRHIERV
jgi:hypothetical protein